MSNGKPMRAVICYDIDIDGGLSDAAKFEALLKEFSIEFKGYLKNKDPELAKIVNFSQEQAEVPMQERRGATGSLGDIVFRGSRVTSGVSKHGIEVRVITNDEKKMIVKSLGDGGTYSYPVMRTGSHRTKLQTGNRAGETLKLNRALFEKFAKPVDPAPYE